MKRILLTSLILTVIMIFAAIMCKPTKAATIVIHFTAPYDCETIACPESLTVSLYEVRYMECGDTLEFNWDSATVYPNSVVPQPPGSAESISMLNIRPGTYCIAVKSYDGRNYSAVSNLIIKTVEDQVPPSKIVDATAEVIYE